MVDICSTDTTRRPLVPSPLGRGDTIGVVAPSGPVDTNDLNAGLRYLHQWGFRVVVGRNAAQRVGYLAGSDEERSSDVNAMLRATEVRAIAFARGGYGIMRILEWIDRDAVERDPKPLIGMSDITALQLSLYARCGLVTFSGPMVAGQIAQGLDAHSEASVVESLLTHLAGRDLLPKNQSVLKVLRDGYASGPLLVGCLSLITALIGTSHCPNFDGTILLVEDVHEAPYRIDRMMTHLKLAGVLDALSGMILGHFLGSGDRSIRSSVERRALELTSNTSIPLVSGYPHGHALPNLTLPCGMPVELETSPLRFSVSGQKRVA